MYVYINVLSKQNSSPLFVPFKYFRTQKSFHKERMTNKQIKDTYAHIYNISMDWFGLSRTRDYDFGPMDIVIQFDGLYLLLVIRPPIV